MKLCLALFIVAFCSFRTLLTREGDIFLKLCKCLENTPHTDHLWWYDVSFFMKCENGRAYRLKCLDDIFKAEVYRPLLNKFGIKQLDYKKKSIKTPVHGLPAWAYSIFNNYRVVLDYFVMEETVDCMNQLRPHLHAKRFKQIPATAPYKDRAVYANAYEFLPENCLSLCCYNKTVTPVDFYGTTVPEK